MLQNVQLPFAYLPFAYLHQTQVIPSPSIVKSLRLFSYIELSVLREKVDVYLLFYDI